MSPSVPSDSGEATSSETIAAMLERSNRDFVPIRRSFVQSPARGGGAGPLASFVSQRRNRTLDLYLLLHSVASSPPFDVDFASIVWARALGIHDQKGAAAAISRSWTWLESRSLISSRRQGRHRVITLLREDGSGEPYAHPGRSGNYLKLPYAYWTGNFHNRINLPAKAVLLIALSQRDQFVLPGDQAANWYGISKETARRGIRILRTHGLLEASTRTKKAPLSPAGITKERIYSLRRPFDPMPRGTAPQ